VVDQSRLEDISVSGARIHLLCLINPEMTTEEFFLVMTSDGQVRRRSKLVRAKDSKIGVELVEEARPAPLATKVNADWCD
jgi:hypothetical protein